jgi:hypothetical protein
MQNWSVCTRLNWLVDTVKWLIDVKKEMKFGSLKNGRKLTEELSPYSIDYPAEEGCNV